MAENTLPCLITWDWPTQWLKWLKLPPSAPHLCELTASCTEQSTLKGKKVEDCPFKGILERESQGTGKFFKQFKFPLSNLSPLRSSTLAHPSRTPRWNMNKQAMSGSAAPQVGEVRLEERPNHHDKPDKSLGLRKIYWIPGIDRKKYAGFSHPLFQKLQVWDWFSRSLGEVFPPRSFGKGKWSNCDEPEDTACSLNILRLGRWWNMCPHQTWPWNFEHNVDDLFVIICSYTYWK